MNRMKRIPELHERRVENEREGKTFKKDTRTSAVKATWRHRVSVQSNAWTNIKRGKVQ
jgi:hypothetical protein